MALLITTVAYISIGSFFALCADIGENRIRDKLMAVIGWPVFVVYMIQSWLDGSMRITNHRTGKSYQRKTKKT